MRTSRPPEKRGCGDRRRCQACTPVHVGGHCRSAEVEISKRRSAWACETGAAGAQEEGR